MAKLILISIVIIFLHLYYISAQLITIPQGAIQGSQNFSRDGNAFYSFKGIPYGKSQRFRESEPADGWDGIKDTTKFGNYCLQYDKFRNMILGDEDCLVLNVYTPQVNFTQPKPVMVFVHGGSFIFGSGAEYGPKYFMDEQVVLVSINYRLGPFGYLDTVLGTNIGMKDQTLALKWVQQNIVHFGGDPNSVTIFGESAGSGSVSYHILSPLSRGLFHRAISQSGTATLGPNTQQPPRELKKLGALVDCPTSNARILAECLSTVDGAYILERIILATILPEFQPEDIPQFSINVDTHSPGSVFLPDTPSNLYRTGQFAQVPYITGANSHEGLSFFIPLVLSEAARRYLNDNWQEVAPATFVYEPYYCQATKEIRQFYVGDEEIESIDSLFNVTAAAGDRIFLHLAKIASGFHSKYASAYLYHFSLRGESTFDPTWFKLNISTDGLAPPAHIDELQYLFDTGYYPEILPGSRFDEFSDWFVKTWVKFATDGTTPENWTPAYREGESDSQWYQIDAELKMVPEENLFNGRLKLWERLFPIV